MAGYNGYSMSNNAVEAYENGEKPLSRWTKAEILEAIEDAISEGELTLNCTMDKLKKTPLKVLKKLCLCYSSWHHTSNHYNITDFYSLNIDRIEELIDEELEEAIADSKAEKEVKQEPAEERWMCAFLEWSGTRKHPKAKEIIEEGTVRGDWFIRSNGRKKKTSANGFRYIKRIQ